MTYAEKRRFISLGKWGISERVPERKLSLSQRRLLKWLLSIVTILLFCTIPARATWTLTQVQDNTNCAAASSTCAVTVTSTGSAHLLVAGFISGTNGSNTISSVTAAACSATWTHAANTATSASGDGESDQFYCPNSASGQTSITITLNAAPGGSKWIAVIWEASSSLGNIAVDSGATPSQHVSDTTCTSCAGVSLTLSGNNDFITALAPCGGTCSGVTGTGWTNDLSNPSGDGVAHGITSGTQTAPATWTQTSSTLIANAAAFQETSSGGSTPGFDKQRRLEQLEAKR